MCVRYCSLLKMLCTSSNCCSFCYHDRCLAAAAIRAAHQLCIRRLSIFPRADKVPFVTMLGAWRRLPFVCVPRISYASAANAVSFLTADLALPGDPPIRHVLVGLLSHDS